MDSIVQVYIASPDQRWPNFTVLASNIAQSAQRDLTLELGDRRRRLHFDESRLPRAFAKRFLEVFVAQLPSHAQDGTRPAAAI